MKPHANVGPHSFPHVGSGIYGCLLGLGLQNGRRIRQHVEIQMHLLAMCSFRTIACFCFCSAILASGSRVPFLDLPAELLMDVNKA